MTTVSGKTVAKASPASLFCCDHCDYEMPVKPDLAGRRARCPKCGQVGRVGSSGPAHDPNNARAPRIKPSMANPTAYALKEAGGPSDGTYHAETPTGAPAGKAVRRLPEPTTRCPFCQEEILSAARKCKHCGEYLDEALRQVMEHGRTANVQAQPHRFSISLPRPAILGVAAVVLVGLGIVVWLATRGGGAPTQGPAPAQPTVAPATASPAFEAVGAAVRKALEGTEVKDAGGSVMRFLNEAEGGTWQSSVRKADAPGKQAHATIEVPYRLTSTNPKVASARGKLVLEFAKQGNDWRFQSASRRVCIVVTAGKEQELPEEDQQVFQLAEQDHFLRHIRGILQKATPSKDD